MRISPLITAIALFLAACSGSQPERDAGQHRDSSALDTGTEDGGGSGADTTVADHLVADSLRADTWNAAIEDASGVEHDPILERTPQLSFHCSQTRAISPMALQQWFGKAMAKHNNSIGVLRSTGDDAVFSTTTPKSELVTHPSPVLRGFALPITLEYNSDFLTIVDVDYSGYTEPGSGLIHCDPIP